MFTKMTYQRRMQSYIILMILFSGGVALLSGIIALQHKQLTTSELHQEARIEITVAEMYEVQDIQPVEDGVLKELVSPDDYEGVIMVATVKEVITMQIIDGVKHFTNHLIG